MKPEPMLVPPPPRTLTVITLGSTFFATPARESGARWVSPGPPPVPSRVVPTPPRLAKTNPSVPPSAPASSAVITEMSSTRPRPRRGPSPDAPAGGSNGGGSTGGGVMTTAAGAAGSRHGSASASDHHGEPDWDPGAAPAAPCCAHGLDAPAAAIPGRAPLSVTIGTPSSSAHKDYTDRRPPHRARV